MSTQIQRIEKEYFLSKLAGEQIPVVYLFNRKDYTLKVDKINKDDIEFITEEPIEGLLANKKINLMFDFKGLHISFSAEVKSITENVIKTTIPDTLYKNLERSNQRVSPPTDMRIEIISLDDRYSLPFPKSSMFEKLDTSAVLPNVAPEDFNTIVKQMGQEMKPFISGIKIVYYNSSVQPSKPEERIVAETGKTLLVKSTSSQLLDAFSTDVDGFITLELLRRYYESIGVGVTFLDQTIEQFMKNLADESITSAVWVPFLFQEYVVGYIYAWTSAPLQGAADSSAVKPTLTEEIAKKLSYYGKCIVFSLSKRAYFEAGRLKDRLINGKVADISASGLRFAVQNSFVFQFLQPGVELGLKLVMPAKTIMCKMKIRRRYKEGGFVYLGCSFVDISPIDAQYIFTFIYGTPQADETKKLVTNNV